MEFSPNVPVELKKPDAEAITNAWRANHDTDFSEVTFVTMFDMLADGDQQGRLDRRAEGGAGAGGHEGDRHGRRAGDRCARKTTSC